MKKAIKKSYLYCKFKILEFRYNINLKRVDLVSLLKDLRYNRIKSMVINRFFSGKQEKYFIKYIITRQRKQIILNKEQYEKFNKKWRLKCK